MKKLLITLLFALPAFAQAAIIYTDEAEFLAKYENPTKSIDFATYVPTRASTHSSGNVESFYSDSFGAELFFETRRAGDLGWSWTAVDRLKTGGPIFASDLENIQGERIGVSSAYYTIVALYTSAGFFGWVPELHGPEVADTLLLLPIGAAINSVEWGFTAKPTEAPEPNAILLLLAGLTILLIRTSFKRQIAKPLVVALSVLALSSPTFAASHKVKSYTKKNGTHVTSHRKTNSDHSTRNNWSTKGNVNPYTGKKGSKNPRAK